MKKILLIVNKLPIPYYRDGVTLINYRILKHAPSDFLFDIVSITKEETETVQSLINSFENIRNVYSSNSSSPSAFVRFVSLFYYVLIGQSLCTFSLSKKLKTFNLDDYCMIYIATPPTPLYFSKLIIGYPLFINAIDSFSLLNNRFYSHQKDLYSYIKKLIYKIAERKCFKKADLVNFVSDLDKEFCSNFCKSNNLISITNGVDTEYFTPNFKNREKCSILFVGNFNYKPNVDAVNHFVKNILPQVKKVYPSVIFYIVGINGHFDFKDKNILVTGFIDDLRYYYKKATIFVSPLKSGSGVKNKVLEAMASGIPVISTSIGVDGVAGIENTKNAIIANSDEDFSNNLIQLFQDNNRRFELASLARRLVEDHYSWQETVSIYFQWFRKIIKNTV